MLNFKLFIEASEEEINVRDILKKVPKAHADLIKDYKIIMQVHNTLNNDKTNVGMIDPKKKTITLAGSWGYGRGQIFTHELAHAYYDNLMPEELKKEWDELMGKIKKKNKKIADNSNEENFCMFYANYYSDNPIIAYSNKECYDFIKKLP